MYKVHWLYRDEEFVRECVDLSEALEVAKSLAVFVTIKSKEIEIVGVFGVDSVQDGICPDGVEYTWKKRRV